MGLLTLIRGLPGSGKTTLARKIADTYVEADQYFMRGGLYQFQEEQLPRAHEWCLEETRRVMNHHNTVAVSNTFVRLEHMRPYALLAEELGWIVQIIEVFGCFGSTHEVPPDVMEQMAQNWEPVRPAAEDRHMQIRKAVYQLRDFSEKSDYCIRVDCNLIGSENLDVYRQGSRPVDEKGLGR